MAVRTNKTADDIRESHGRKQRAIIWEARLPEFKEVCAYWHNHFGACLTLDRARLNALVARMVDGRFTLDDIKLAIDAYHQHVTTDPWYREAPRANPAKPAGTNAHKQLAEFLLDEKFERWLQEGKLAWAKQIDARRRAELAGADTRRSAQTAGLLGAFDGLPRERRQDLINRATAALQAEGKTADFSAVKARALDLFREEAKCPSA